MGQRAVDISSGTRIGDWTVLERAANKPYGGWAFLCRCVCGTERTVSSSSLRRDSNGCGCRNRAAFVARGRTHGLYRTRLHNIHRMMLARCYDPNHMYYFRYGGRGIKVCARWHDLRAFAEDNAALWNTDLTIERVDNDGDYTPENCTWIPRPKQARNRHDTIYLTFRGETKQLTVWAEDLRLPSLNALYLRYYKGWSHERILTEPLHT